MRTTSRSLPQTLFATTSIDLHRHRTEVLLFSPAGERTEGECGAGECGGRGRSEGDGCQDGRIGGFRVDIRREEEVDALLITVLYRRSHSQSMSPEKREQCLFLTKMPISQDGINVTLTTSGSTAVVALLGASVHSWKEGGTERLFTSSLSSLSGPKAIRGGIPICFPCFGPPPKGNPKFDKLPQHGFARTSKWTLVESSSGDDEDGRGVHAVFRTSLPA